MTKLDVKALLASFGIFFGVIDMANAGEPVAEGQEIYESFCAACHGSDGKPMIPDAPNFSSGERMEKTDAELLVSIMEGKGDPVSPERLREPLIHSGTVGMNQRFLSVLPGAVEWFPP